MTLGNFSTKFILKTEVGITRLHGTLQRAGRFKVFPIFHPAAALYDGSKREALENDFATLGQLLREGDSGAAPAPAADGTAAAASAAAGSGMLAEATPGPPAAAAAAPAAAAPAAAQSAQPAAAQPHLL